MRLLLFYQYFGTPNGSWSTRAYENAKRWVNDGHKVAVVTCPYYKSDIKAKGFISHQKVDGIDVYVINTPDSNLYNFLKRVINATAFAIISIWYSLFLRYDVIISSSGPITTGLALFPAKWIRRKKTVFEVRDLWPAGGIEMGLINNRFIKAITLRFEKAIYKVSDLIVTCSVGQETHIKKRFPELKTLVIPNSSDVEFFSSVMMDVSGLSELEKTIISNPFVSHIGSLGFIHGCDFILETAFQNKDEFRKRNLQLIFIGDGAERKMLESKKEKLGLEFVHFLGPKPKKDLPFWFQTSICTLFTTLNNPVQNTSSPNKIFDSFASKTPIIQNTTGWIKDLVDRESCGINCPPGNSEAFGKAIFKIYDDPKLRDKLSKGALRVANELFNRDILAKHFLKEIKKL